MKIIESDRLYIRTLSLTDTPTLYSEIFSDPDVVKHTFGQEIGNLSQAQNYIASNGNFNDYFGLSALVNKEEDQVIGLAGVLECNYLGQTDYEFGFILGKNHWGKGYATEIGQAQIDYIKNTLNTPRVIALAEKSNIGSVKTLQRLGLTYTKTVTTADRGDRDVFILAFNR